MGIKEKIVPTDLDLRGFILIDMHIMTYALQKNGKILEISIENDLILCVFASFEGTVFEIKDCHNLKQLDTLTKMIFT